VLSPNAGLKPVAIRFRRLLFNVQLVNESLTHPTNNPRGAVRLMPEAYAECRSYA